MRSLFVVAFAALAGCSLGYNYTTVFFDTKVDHFGYANNDTFKMRYLVNLDHFDRRAKHPVVFFYAGNEGDIVDFANNTGLMWDWAPEFKAAVVFAEHRFYGESMPYGNKSYSDPKYYGYLTVEQALADYADMLMQVKQKLPGTKVVAFGGSYGGMLAAWMRIKYPWLIDAALAASAPILQFQDVTPCGAYNQVVTKAFAREGQKCADNIRKSWTALDNKAKSGANGLDFLRANFKLCQKIDGSNYTAVRDWLFGTYGNLAMVNYPYSTDFIKKVPGHPVRESCKFLQKDFANDDDLLLGIYQAMNVFHNFSGDVQCNDLAKTNGDKIQDKGWNIQTCSEMVMPFCGDGKIDMFYPYSWDFNAYRANCQNTYKITPDLYKAQMMFGAKDIHAASRIIFSNGDVDPWSSGGVLKSLGPSLPAIMIKDGAHHYDLRPAHPDDTEHVRRARELEKMYIKAWLHEKHHSE